MSERKVLNKYYPPDFDPSKIPKLRLPRNRQYSIRIMSPFNMRCNTCGEYIYKGKKFNSRKETVENEDYLGLKIFRFYIKCPRCVAEIAFKTDPQNTDYALEDGATRNFEPLRTAEMLAEAEQKEKEDEELNNPMKVLENRTKASRQEMEMLETLEELREQNSRHADLDHDQVIQLHTAYKQQLLRLQEEEDENLVQSIFGDQSEKKGMKRLPDVEEEEEEESPVVKKVPKLDKPTDVLTGSRSSGSESAATKRKPAIWEKSIGSLSSKSSLSMLVKKKQPGAKVRSNVKTGSTASVTTKNPNSEKDITNGPVVNKAPEDKKEEKQNCSSPDINNVKLAKPTTDVQPKVSAPTGLGLLGSYSDSGSDSQDSDE